MGTSCKDYNNFSHGTGKGKKYNLGTDWRTDMKTDTIITFDYPLNFNSHVSIICKKAAKQINVILRLSKYLYTEIKLLIFKSFIRSNFSYCPLVWHFCSKTSTDKMEKLQYRALRLVFSDFDSSYEDLLTKANMPTLQLDRTRIIAREVFKILNGLSPSYIQDLVTLKSTNYSFRYQNLLEQPRVNIYRYGKNSFRFDVTATGSDVG